MANSSKAIQGSALFLICSKFNLGTKHETKATAMNFAQMVEAEIPALRRHARAVTRDSDLADDIVQDTLVRALRSEHLFQGAKIRSWLHTILINLNRNRLRSLARQPRMSPIKENDASDFAGPEAGGRDIERAWHPGGGSAERTIFGGARRIELSRGRQPPSRANGHGDVAFGARACTHQNLSRR
jgi:hypothetical protein